MGFGHKDPGPYSLWPRKKSVEKMINAFPDRPVTKRYINETLKVNYPQSVRLYMRLHREYLDSREKNTKFVLERLSKEPQTTSITPLKTTMSDSPFKKRATKSAAKKKTKTAPAKKRKAYMLTNDLGHEQELEVVVENDSVVLLQIVAPQLRTITVRGAKLEVDLRKLRQLDPNSKQHGIEVSKLLVLAELS